MAQDDHFAQDKKDSSYTAAIVVVSDRAADGSRPDETAPQLKEILQKANWSLACIEVIPDEQGQIEELLKKLGSEVEFVITTGGTGPAPRDVTPEATANVIEREFPGIAEIMRVKSFEKASGALGSRALAGSYQSCVIVNLPGSPRGACECLEWILPGIRHIVGLLQK